MTRLAYAAPLAVLALLSAGCGTRAPQSTASNELKPVEHPYRAGTGVVQAVTPAPGPIAAGPQSYGRNPNAAPTESGLQRLRIRMDDGRMLWVDTTSRDFQPGQRVQLSEASQIERR